MAYPPLLELAGDITLILASTSPRRRQFLEEWGLPFSCIPPRAAEPMPESGEDPVSFTMRAAQAKARAVRESLPAEMLRHALILAADTAVTVDGVILGKPRSQNDAVAMLQRLAGCGHAVTSSVCLLLPAVWPAPREELFSDSCRVHFYDWPAAMLHSYAATHEPDDKAGAYAVQGQGAFLVERIEGSWTTVVGLPVGLLARVLLQRELVKPGMGKNRDMAVSDGFQFPSPE